MKKQKNENLNKQYSTWNNFLYVLSKVAHKQKKLIFLLGIQAIISSILVFALPFISKIIIDAVTKKTSVEILLVIIISMFFLQAIFTVIEGYVSLQVWWKIIHARMNFIPLRIKKFISMNYQNLENPEIRDLARKANVATDGNADGIEGLLRSTQTICIDVVKIIISVTLISFLNPIIAIIMFVLAYLGFFITNKTRKSDKIKTWDALVPFWRKRDYIQNVAKDFTYAKDIRIFQLQNSIAEKEKNISNDIHKKMVESNNRWIISSTLIHLILFIYELVLYAWLIYLVINKNLGIGNFSLYLVTIRTFFTTISSFLDAISKMKKQSSEINDFRTFVELADDDNTEEPMPVPIKNEYVICLEDVSFRYPNQERYALRNINLTINASDRLAIVGLNGSGKTTLIKLICRLYDVTEGRILLNNVDIRKYRRNEYYKLFAPIFQNIEMFAFPLAENVSMKTPKKTKKDKAIKTLERSGFGDKLNRLPKGVDSQVLKVLHEDGIDLSGGERQKVAIARALYKDAPIVILDEPTSALDPIAEKTFYEGFNDIIGSKSAIYISHRLSSTRFCDRIVLLSGGKITEIGTHEELIGLNGEYSDLFNMQAKYYQDESANQTERAGG